MRIAIICARGGSKGVPGKNIREIAGIPLIAHTIVQAADSGMFSCIMVSSDDDNILKIAEKYAAKTVQRPPEMATDESGVMPAVRHALAEVEKRDNVEFQTICLLQTTSPLRTPYDIKSAIIQLELGDMGNIFSVCEASSSPIL